MQLLLMEHRDPNLRSYFVWGPYIRSDNETAARRIADRFVSPQAAHYWTPTPRLAENLASVLKLPSGLAAWDVFLLYPKGTLWDMKVPAPHYWQHQLEIVQGEPFDVTTFDAHIVRALGSSSPR